MSENYDNEIEVDFSKTSLRVLCLSSVHSPCKLLVKHFFTRLDVLQPKVRLKHGLLLDDFLPDCRLIEAVLECFAAVFC